VVGKAVVRFTQSRARQLSDAPTEHRVETQINHQRASGRRTVCTFNRCANGGSKRSRRALMQTSSSNFRPHQPRRNNIHPEAAASIMMHCIQRSAVVRVQAVSGPMDAASRPGGGASRAASPVPAAVPVPVALPTPISVSRPGGGAGRMGPSPSKVASSSTLGSISRPGGGGSRMASVLGPLNDSAAAPYALPERPGGGGSRGSPFTGAGQSDQPVAPIAVPDRPGGGGGRGTPFNGGGGGGGDDDGGKAAGGGGEEEFVKSYAVLFAGWAGACAAAYAIHNVFIAPRKAPKRSCCQGKTA